VLDEIKSQSKACVKELLDVAGLEVGDIVVVGCSTSEIKGDRLGTASDEAVGEAVFSAIYPVLRDKGLWLAAQCCEHLNRALVIEKEAAARYNLRRVSVVPVPKAGGAWASAAYRDLPGAIVVEDLGDVKAAAAVDIGEVCVGMHLKPVAVMVRPSYPWIGKARVTMIRTRPKLIGGERARYS